MILGELQHSIEYRHIAMQTSTNFYYLPHLSHITTIKQWGTP